MIKNKYFKITIAIVILTICLTIFIACDNGGDLDNEKNLSNWMSMIKDDALITQLVIPGSHDSGTKGMLNIMETQDKTYYEQLNCGFRYFDTRVMYNEGEYVMFHTLAGEMKYSQVLSDIKKFLEENPTEFIVLDYQKFQGDNQDGIFDMLEEQLGDRLIEVEGEDNVAFVESLTLGEVRGKILVFVGKEQSQLDRPYQMPRDNDCEARENSALRSYYKSEYNKSDSETYVNTYLQKYIDMYKESQGGMFVLQGQLTGGNIKQNEEKHSPNMNEYTKNLYNSENLQYINIIMRDYVDMEKASIILELNIAKELVQDNKLEDYRALLQ